jgi:cytochrome bd-type quinol oxidase subunit 2
MWDSCLEPGTDVATLACIPIIIKNVITAALVFAGIIAVALIIFAGAKYITSKGDQAKIDSAKKTLTYAFVGLAIIFLSFFIVSFISQMTGVSQIANPTL